MSVATIAAMAPGTVFELGKLCPVISDEAIVWSVVKQLPSGKTILAGTWFGVPIGKFFIDGKKLFRESE